MSESRIYPSPPLQLGTGEYLSFDHSLFHYFVHCRCAYEWTEKRLPIIQLITTASMVPTFDRIVTFDTLLAQTDCYASSKCLRKTNICTRTSTLSVNGLRFSAHNFRRIMKINGLSRHIGRINSALDTTVRSHGWTSTGRKSWKIMSIFLSKELTDLL